MFTSNQASEVDCKPLKAKMAEKTNLYSNWWLEYFDLIEIVKHNCVRKEVEYDFWQYYQDTSVTKNLKEATKLNSDMMACNKEVSEKHVESLTNAIKICEGSDVKIEDQTTARDAFYEARKAFNEVENAFGDAEDGFKKFQKQCDNPTKFYRFKAVDDWSDCSEECFDKLPMNIAYPNVGKLYLDLMNITQVMSNL